GDAVLHREVLRRRRAGFPLRGEARWEKLLEELLGGDVVGDRWLLGHGSLLVRLAATTVRRRARPSGHAGVRGEVVEEHALLVGREPRDAATREHLAHAADLDLPHLRRHRAGGV